MVFDERRFSCALLKLSMEEGTIWPCQSNWVLLRWKDGASGVDPSGVPSGRDALGSKAVSWPGVVVGQAVPNRQGFRVGRSCMVRPRRRKPKPRS